MPESRELRRKRRKREQLERRGSLILAGLIICLTLLMFSVWMLVRIIHDYRSARETYRIVAEQYTSTSESKKNLDSGKNDNTDTGSDQKAYTDYGEQPAIESDDEEELEIVTLPFEINWRSLRRKNRDTVGWLYCEGTDIHYPVVQGKNNEYYLTHDFNKKRSTGGALFLDFRNKVYFNSDHLMIYGHRMNDGSMFGSTTGYARESYYLKHPVLYFLTPEQSWRAEIIGCRTVHSEDKYFRVFFENEQVYSSYLQRLRLQRYYATIAEPDIQYRLLTLVTCSKYYDDDVRLLIHARLVPVHIAP